MVPGADPATEGPNFPPHHGRGRAVHDPGGLAICPPGAGRRGYAEDKNMPSAASKSAGYAKCLEQLLGGATHE